MEWLPDEINFLRFYYPSNRGFEEEVMKKMNKKKNIFKSSQKKDLENNQKVSEFEHRSSDPAIARKKRKKLYNYFLKIWFYFRFHFTMVYIFHFQ